MKLEIRINGERVVNEEVKERTAQERAQDAAEAASLKHYQFGAAYGFRPPCRCAMPPGCYSVPADSPRVKRWQDNIILEVPEGLGERAAEEVREAGAVIQAHINRTVNSELRVGLYQRAAGRERERAEKYKSKHADVCEAFEYKIELLEDTQKVLNERTDELESARTSLTEEINARIQVEQSLQEANQSLSLGRSTLRQNEDALAACERALVDEQKQRIAAEGIASQLSEEIDRIRGLTKATPEEAGIMPCQEERADASAQAASMLTGLHPETIRAIRSLQDEVRTLEAELQQARQDVANENKIAAAALDSSGRLARRLLRLKESVKDAVVQVSPGTNARLKLDAAIQLDNDLQAAGE